MMEREIYRETGNGITKHKYFNWIICGRDAFGIATAQAEKPRKASEFDWISLVSVDNLLHSHDEPFREEKKNQWKIYFDFYCVTYHGSEYLFTKY